MKVTYTGKLDNILPAQQKKLEAKFGKLGKLLDGKEQREAHVIISPERRSQRAEVTLNYYDHPLVGIAKASDSFTAIMAALEKLEKQALKQRAKWRDTRRGADQGLKQQPVVPASPRPEAAEAAPQRRIVRVNRVPNRKPLTLEEAVLELEAGGEYLAFRDSDTDRLSVLLRRKDGNFDLIES